MRVKRHSFGKALLRRVPMPVLAALFGLLTAAAVWTVIDPIQTRAIDNIFHQEFQAQLETRARESLARFDNFVQSYVNTARLLARHRRMADYLEPLVWFSADEEPPVVYRDRPPLWLPASAIDGLPVRPSHAVLVDLDGRIREIYELSGEPLPPGMKQELDHALDSAGQQAYMTRLGDELYLIIAEQVEDASYYQMGALVLLVPVNGAFLDASQQRAPDSDTTVALVDGDSQTILVAEGDNRLLEGQTLPAVEKEYAATVQSFFDYGKTPLNLLFATLMPRDLIDATRSRIIAVERRHRLTGAAIVGLIFVLLFILVSNRINRLLRRVADFSARALHIEQPMPKGGNRLLILEDWIRSFTQAVMRAREEMRAHYTAEIEERETLKTAVLDASLDPIVTIDQDGRIVDFNPTASKVFGYQQDEVLGRKLDELVFDPDSRAAFNSQLHDCLLEGDRECQPVLRKLQARNKQGETLPVEVAIKPVWLEDRLLFTTYIRDISERERQAREIASLAAFPSESPWPVMRVNQDGVVIYANKAAEPLLEHWNCERMQTVPIYWRRLVESVLAGGRPHEEELRAGDKIYSMLLAPVPDLDYVNLYGRDITAMRRAEEEARHRQNELIHVSRLSTMGEMATGIAHELNQPLSAIVNFANGCARRLRLGIGEKQELIAAMEQIANQARRAGEIIKRLRGMVTRQAPVRRVVDLNTLVRDACALIDHDRRQLQVKIESRLSERPVMVRADPVQIEQVILNLLRNALDALRNQDPERRHMVVRTSATPDGTARIEVEDNGSGIAPDALRRLFDPFFSTKKSGMGMGLSISQTIVTDHNGRIEARSVPGRGAVFTVELPLADTEMEKAS